MAANFDITKIQGQDISTLTVTKIFNPDAYNSLLAISIDTVQIGVDLGTCTTVLPDTSNAFFWGTTYWMIFDAPPSAIGDNGNVTGSFSVLYVPGAFNVGGNPDNDDDGSNIFNNIASAVGGTVNFFIIAAIVIVAFFMLMIYLKNK